MTLDSKRTYLDRRVIQWSVILYIALLMPISLLHETGHAVVCSSEGFGYSLWLDWTGGHTLCSGIPASGIEYGVMGGVFGLLGSTVIIALWALVRRARRHPAMLVVGLAYFVDQGVKTILEGFFTVLYTSGATDVLLTILQVASWIGLTIYFARVPLAMTPSTE
jgi:hypothetical protein